MATYYIDGTTLSNSTAVYDNAAMTLCAADGFYSDGVIVREQVNCSLLPAQTCPTCAEPCGGTINGSGAQGIYLLDLDVGGTPTDTGAILVMFNPRSVPDGIRATFNSTVYNKVSSPVDGYHGSTSTSNFTFIGAQNSDCGISGSTYNLNEFNYVGGSFQQTGNTQSVTVNPGDVSLGSAPGDCIMVIPKPNPTPSVVNFEFVGPCAGTIFDIRVSCPAALPSYSSTTVPRSLVTDACGDTINQTYYHAPVNGTAGVPALYDWVFSDPNGQSVLLGGWYKIENANGVQYPIQVDDNGVIITIEAC
jgi:hypothetical protein